MSDFYDTFIDTEPVKIRKKYKKPKAFKIAKTSARGKHGRMRISW